LIDNIDLDSANSPIDPRGICHMNITSRPRVREFVIGRIQEAINAVTRLAPPLHPC
jgi:hypothetical protein